MNLLERVIITRVRHQLVQQKIKLKQFAHRTSIPEERLTRLMDRRGKGRWDLITVQQVAKGLGIPAWQLLVEHPQDTVPKELVALMEDYQGLCPKRRQMVDDALTAARLQRKKLCPKNRTDAMSSAYDAALKRYFTRHRWL